MIAAIFSAITVCGDAPGFSRQPIRCMTASTAAPCTATSSSGTACSAPDCNAPSAREKTSAMRAPLPVASSDRMTEKKKKAQKTATRWNGCSATPSRRMISHAPMQPMAEAQNSTPPNADDRNG